MHSDYVAGSSVRSEGAAQGAEREDAVVVVGGLRKGEAAEASAQ